MILFDTTPLQSEHRLRGLGTYTLNIALELLQICPADIRFAVTARDAHLVPEVIRRRAVAVRRGHRPAQIYWLYNEWFLREVTRRVQPSLIHSTDFNGLVTSRRIPTIATLHDTTVLKEGLKHTTLSGKLSDLRWWVYFYKKLPKAAHIIAISESVKTDAVNLLGIPEEKITVIPHGIDTERFHPDTRLKRVNQPYLLFVGGRNKNKNVGRVLQAFSQLGKQFPDLLLFIAGAWSQGDLTWLQQQVGALKLNQAVHHLGYVPDEELPSLYSNARAFLFPSLEEGFGLPILEAMACGTPVVTSNRGAMMEVSGNAAKLVDPESVDELVNSIHEILTKPRIREQLITSGLIRASAFSWRSSAEKTFKVYQSFNNVLDNEQKWVYNEQKLQKTILPR